MAPNVIDVNAIDAAEIAALVAIDAPKFAPLTEGLFETPPVVKSQKSTKSSESYWDWSQNDHPCDEDETARQSVVEEKERALESVSVDNIVKDLMRSSEDTKAKADKQYFSADHPQESYWDERTETAVVSEDENDADEHHFDEFAVRKLEESLQKDAARRLSVASQPSHTNSHVGNESHNIANYWFWPSSESDKQTILRGQRNLVASDVIEREEIRKQLSVLTIEASLVREAEDRRNHKKKQVEGTRDDSYWAWNDKSVKASHNPSSWDAYWDFESTNRDAMVHEVMRHEEARQAVSVDRIESNLLRELKDREKSKSEKGEVTGCSDDDYWSWSDDHLVKSSRNPSCSDLYWNFGATGKDVAVHEILAQEEARRAVEVGRLEHHLVQESRNRKEYSVTVTCSTESVVEGYWDW